jgi:hypothetical protein
MPTGSRRFSTFTGTTVGVIIVIIFQIGFFFKLIPIEDQTFDVGFVKFSASGMANSSMSNWVIFGVRNTITAICYPNRLTIIQSPVVSEKVTKLQEKLLTAAFHLKEAGRILLEGDSGLKSQHF